MGDKADGEIIGDLLGQFVERAGSWAQSQSPILV